MNKTAFAAASALFLAFVGTGAQAQDVSTLGLLRPDISLFGDAMAVGSFQDGPPAFGVGNASIFARVQPHDRLQLLGEFVFGFKGNTNQSKAELDRIQAHLIYDDRLKLTVGRFHESIGYYNTTYQSALLFQTTSSRPGILGPGEHNALIPLHGTGIKVSGEFATAAFQTGYAVDVVNGRGRTPDEDLGSIDLNAQKGVNLLSYIQHRDTAIRAGVNLRVDWIPQLDGESPGALGHPPLVEYLVGLHFVIDRPSLLLIAEGYWIAHRALGGTTESASALSATRAGFVEALFRLEPVSPYLRVEAQDQPNGGDFFFSANERYQSQATLTGGVRRALTEAAVVKVEYEVRTSAAGLSHKLAAQLAFGL